MIPRLVSDELMELLGYFPVLGLTGSRQAGKTTLSRELAKFIVIEKGIIYLDLENPDDVSRLFDPVLYLRAYNESCIIIDEV